MKHKLVLYFSLFCLNVYGQVDIPEKRIYLIDVTGSMVGKGNISTPDIFSEVKDGLMSAINAIQDTTTEIVLIPFTDKPLSEKVFMTNNKDEILAYIRELKVHSGDTNIADAWSFGVQKIDTTKINYLFLLTDGLHNCGPDKQVLYDHIQNWSMFSSQKYFFAFYVMLTPNAKEQEIVQIIDNSEQIWLIESMDVNALFIRTDFVLRTNIHDNKKVNILFSINRQNYLTEDFDFSIKMEDNPHYQITDVENNLVKGNQVNFNILEKVPLLSIPTHTILGIDIVYDKVKYPLVFFTPEHINFEILNKGIRKMEIKAK